MLRNDGLRVFIFLLAYTLTWSCAFAKSNATPSRRALVVGISHYLAPDASRPAIETRRLPALAGASRDARLMAKVLDAQGYDVRLLLDGQATRAAILEHLEEYLIGPTRSRDDLVFYFSGHGSQSPSEDPNEPEGNDETLVPADANRGAPDLLDDELRHRFGPAVRRGARLTLIIDACHSGSITRGLPAFCRPRAAERLKAAAATSSKKLRLGRSLPDLEDGNTLVLAASQDFQLAYETFDMDGKPHGVFTHALLQALSSAAPTESAAMTFRRASAIIAGGHCSQRPVLKGTTHRKREPIFSRPTNRSGRSKATVQAVVLDVEDEGRVTLEGGWTAGLREGDELAHGSTRIQLQSVDPVRSLGQRISTQGEPPILRGDVFKRVRLGAPQPKDLAVWAPTSPKSAKQLIALDRRIDQLAQDLGIARVENPWDPSTHTLRFLSTTGWQLIDHDAPELPMSLGHMPSDASLRSSLRPLPPTARLLVQLPLPNETKDQLDIGAGQRIETIARLATPGTAHYQLVGQRRDDRLTYTWVRAGADLHDLNQSQFPLRTRELELDDPRFLAFELTQQASKLARIRFWLLLESPKEGGHFPYHLALHRDASRIRHEPSSKPRNFPRVDLAKTYGAALWSAEDPGSVEPRYLYIVLIDSHGRRKLMFPNPLSGSVENHYPIENQLLEDRRWIPIGAEPILRVTKPLGLDTYILLTTDEPLPDPSVLDEDGVRSPRHDDHPLARLFLKRHGGQRGDNGLPVDWSIDRLTVLPQLPGECESEACIDAQ